MRQITMNASQHTPDTQSGESLHFELCKGGGFSSKDEYGLKVVGKTYQDSLTGSNLFKAVSANLHNNNLPAFTSDLIPLEDFAVSADQKFTLFCKNKATAVNATLYDADKNAIITKTILYSNVKITTHITETVWYMYNSSSAVSLTAVPCYISFYLYGEQSNGWSTALDENSEQLAVYKGALSIAPTYEPYCGGIPAPNSNYPITVQSVKCGTKLKIFGENLSNDGWYSEATAPCDLYEGDIWYPVSGKVIKNNVAVVFDGSDDEGWTYDYDGGMGEVYVNLPIEYDYGHDPNGYYSTHINHDYCMSDIYISGATMYIFAYGEALGSLNLNVADIDDWKALFSQDPMTFLLPISTPIIEQHDPQPVFARCGTVNVIQEPIELTADLSATMLKRREQS